MCLQVLTLGSSGKMLSTRRLYLGLSGPQQPQTPATKTEMAISEAWPPTFCNYSCLHASQTTENWGQEMELVTLLSQSSWGRNVELSIGSMEPDCKTHSRFLLWLMGERLRQSKVTLESGARSDRSPRIDQHELALQAAGRESIRKWWVIRVGDRRRRSPHEGHLTHASSCSVQLLRTLWPFLSKQLNPRWEFVLS